MIYAIAFITNDQLRDIKLEGILNPDFVMENYIHEGSFDYTLRVRNSSSYLLWNTEKFKSQSMLNCSRWKTIRGADEHLKKVKELMSTNKIRFSIRGNDLWNKNSYIPVICNVTNYWNESINEKIKFEEGEHKKRMAILTKKLVN